MYASLAMRGGHRITPGLPLKVSALVIALMSVLCIFCVTDISDDSIAESSGTCGDNCTWALSDDGVLTISGDGSMADYSNGSPAPWHPVKSSVKSVVISDGVTSIGDYAFSECTSIASVAIGDSVASIGFCTFSGCNSLARITIPSSVTSIDYGAFSGCISLKEVTNNSILNIVKGSADFGYAGYYAETVSGSAIEWVSGDYEVTYNESSKICSVDKYTGSDSDIVISDVTINGNVYQVIHIGTIAFSGCTSLVSVTIGDSVTTIGSQAFFGCTSLANVTIGDSVTTIGDRAFEGCTSLANVTIGDSVTIIGKEAFYGCTSLTGIVLGDSVTSIGNGVFHGCISLSSLDVSSGNGSYCSVQGALYSKDMKTLIQYPARNTRASFEIPDTVTSIGDNAFYGCISLVSVAIPDILTYLGDDAFYGCTSLASVTIPDSVTYIGSCAFEGCTSITSMTIPDSVISIGTHAFMGCSLSSIDVSPGNESYCSEQGVLYSKDMKTLIQYPACNTRTSFEIPGTVTSIEEEAFEGCTFLSNVIIPDSVTYIRDYAFLRCTSITSVTIPDSVTYVGYHAFSWCKSLASVSFGDSVTFIGGWAFFGCTSLVSFDVSSGNESYCSVQGVLYSKDMKTLIQYPACNTRTSFEIPGTVTSIGYNALSGCSFLSSIDVSSDNETYCSVQGVLYSKDMKTLIQYPAGNARTSFEIPDTVTSIEDEAFEGCTFLSSVIIPDSVTYIGYYAFDSCTSLSSFDVSSDNEFYCSVQGVLYSKDMKSLIRYPIGNTGTSFEIPDTVTHIEDSAFYGCTHLTTVVIPDSVTYIGYSAFEGCTSIVSIAIGKSAATIGFGAFYGFTFYDEDGAVIDPQSAGFRGHMYHGADYTCLTKAESHIPVTDPAVAATCTATGLSGGSHCSVCGIVIVEPTVLPIVPSAEVGNDGKSYSATLSDTVSYLSSTSIDELVEKAKADPEVTLTVTTSSGAIHLDNKALSNLKSSDSKIGIVHLDSKDYETVVGSSYIYDITFGDNHDNFDGGTITVTVPYSGPTDNLKVYYLAGGKVCETLDCSYADGYVTFKVTHLSTFAVVNQAQDGGSSGNTVVIAVVVIALLAAVALFGVTRMRRRSS